MAAQVSAHLLGAASLAPLPPMRLTQLTQVCFCWCNNGRPSVGTPSRGSLPGTPTTHVLGSTYTQVCFCWRDGCSSVGAPSRGSLPGTPTAELCSGPSGPQLPHAKRSTRLLQIGTSIEVLLQQHHHCPELGDSPDFIDARWANCGMILCPAPLNSFRRQHQGAAAWLVPTSPTLQHLCGLYMQTPLLIALHLEHRLRDHLGLSLAAWDTSAATSIGYLYAEGVRLAISEGGCCASRAAFVGALLGASSGVKDGSVIPRGWEEKYRQYDAVLEHAQMICQARYDMPSKKQAMICQARNDMPSKHRQNEAVFERAQMICQARVAAGA
eukprot:1160797-Pelagomonas_calceolata.AAC.8